MAVISPIELSLMNSRGSRKRCSPLRNRVEANTFLFYLDDQRHPDSGHGVALEVLYADLRACRMSRLGLSGAVVP